MTEEGTRYYFIEEPAPEQKSSHEHRYRVAVGNKTIVRFCKLCGRSWLVAELRDILLHSHFVYYWSEIFEEAEAREKLAGTDKD